MDNIDDGIYKLKCGCGNEFSLQIGWWDKERMKPIIICPSCNPADYVHKITRSLRWHPLYPDNRFWKETANLYVECLKELGYNKTVF